MLLFFTLESSLDTFRTLLCVYEYDGPEDVILTSADLKKDITDPNSKELQPTNVYEDLSRVGYVVVMVFCTQFMLISFVVVDILNSSTHSCPDGTSGCPVGGTLGSWLFYCLGIFMAGVVLLGPKTNFGESEQNPAFWMQLLLNLKANRCRVQWTDKKTGEVEVRTLYRNDWGIWTRFAMSFIINGIGKSFILFRLVESYLCRTTAWKIITFSHTQGLNHSQAFTFWYLPCPFRLRPRAALLAWSFERSACSI
jgi:hypothetical protein